MKTQSLFRAKVALSLAAVPVLLASASTASAATHVLNLTGTLANGNFATFPSGPDEFRVWSLNLDGLNGFLLNVGDDVQATVTLNGSFTVPSSNEMFIGFNLFQDNGNVGPSNASNSGSVTFFNTGPTGLVNDTVSSNCGNCLSNIVFLGAHGAVNFNQLTANFTITSLDDVDFLIDGASLSYQLKDPLNAVPEPATWAMMLGGFGLVGGAMRRRQKVSVTYA
jgi:hypothetical protein